MIDNSETDSFQRGNVETDQSVKVSDRGEGAHSEEVVGGGQHHVQATRHRHRGDQLGNKLRLHYLQQHPGTNNDTNNRKTYRVRNMAKVITRALNK